MAAGQLLPWVFRELMSAKIGQAEVARFVDERRASWQRSDSPSLVEPGTVVIKTYVGIKGDTVDQQDGFHGERLPDTPRRDFLAARVDASSGGDEEALAVPYVMASRPRHSHVLFCLRAWPRFHEPRLAGWRYVAEPDVVLASSA